MKTCPLVKSIPNKTKRAKYVTEHLRAIYPAPACALNHLNPFQLICATILSAQCTDAQVNKVTPALFDKYPNPQSLAVADITDVEKIVHSTGFYKNKAKNLINMAIVLAENYGGEIPNTLEELIKLPGVGRKTANVVLGNAFGVAGMVVDTHVTRLANRFAFVDTEDAVKIEFALMEIIPKESWVDFSHQIILLGREYCTAKKTKCEECPVISSEDSSARRKATPFRRAVPEGRGGWEGENLVSPPSVSFTFGPVPSRRFGRSLGINLVPRKICSLDCLYCEVGKTAAVTLNRKPYIPAEKVLTEFNNIYPSLKNNIDVITLTGAGEPTLNSDLKTIVTEIKKTAAHPLVILTNSTLIADPDVSEALLFCDIVVASLDAVTQNVFEMVDKPAGDLRIDDIIRSIADFSRRFTGTLYLELLLVKGVNDSIDDLEKFAETVKKIRYTKVQLGTVFRPPAWDGTKRLSDDELYAAYEFLSQKGVNAESVGVNKRQNTPVDLPAQLLNMLKMRPVTVDDIVHSTGLSRDEVLFFLSSSGAQKQTHDGEVYYTLSS